MTTLVRDPGAGVRESRSASHGRPVLLGTFEAPLLAEASRVAVDAAVESGQPLIVVNAVETTLTRCDLTFLYKAPPEIEASLREPAQLARGLGLHVERICLRSPRPIEALLELASERDVGLLVVGADPGAMGRGRYRRSVNKLVGRASCLVWVT
jgi:nucleotide-binding universal stress UspA family protein